MTPTGGEATVDAPDVSSVNADVSVNFQSHDRIPEHVVESLIRLVWKTREIARDNLFGWSQGFTFSSAEPTALIQLHGGPCAVIAPVQAYLLKNAIYTSPNSNADPRWREKNGNEVLQATFLELFSLLDVSHFTLVLPFGNPAKRNADAMVHDAPENPDSFERDFHLNLRIQKFSSLNQLQKFLTDHPTLFSSSFGILRFLYSLILSKTIQKIEDDLEDPSEPLIDAAHGHGNQPLTNLIITGRAVNNVWDDVKEFGGLRLQGIHFRPAVGYLSLLENMRYVEVGFYLKCPQYPIWLLGSETHLSIIFALIPSLVTSEAEEAAAIRVFKQYDEHGSGFIDTGKLKDVLTQLDLFREDDYVKSLQDKLDKDNLGLILRSDFLSEFFPHTNKFNNSKPFSVYHYNGLLRNGDTPVKYHHGRATILEVDVDLQIIDIPEDCGNGIDSDSAIVRCLRTKYPRVQIVWDDNKIPSIN
ncbi:hypothetical protein RvY_09981 [Ramazzottius varieornatus]|uniref:Ubiquitin carboxyl-terminal hydrolase MINDY n=1 Tax=Ramazzottius varieornatus TaxID=947166 RepID=A0A1D1VFQ5_RAMVA|nr:hypothetical protein RvY_09981 [Ramazzottius varieornatus]